MKARTSLEHRQLPAVKAIGIHFAGECRQYQCPIRQLLLDRALHLP